ncbi:MAG TPA: hypothetical protein VFT22_22415 [Kofleriaceae bacterium]|nr:hypothetical protein [Kofleriaceae bacterium]
MNKLAGSTLAITSLLVTAGIVNAAPQADLGLDANRMFFRYYTPSADSHDVRIVPDNVFAPIVLPCDTQTFGGQLTIDYPGAGPTVVPHLAITLFDDNGQPISSQTCKKDKTITSVAGDFAAISPGTTQDDGYTPISSTNEWCGWMFQPTDLPADTVVRMHVELTASYLGSPVSDPNLADNHHDIYVRRACSCK